MPSAILRETRRLKPIAIRARRTAMTPELTRLNSPPRRLHQFFERQAEATPQAVALLCGDERWSYADLDRRANQLAHHLVRCGVCPGDRIGILLERSGHTYTTLLAILKAGAAFVPLDPSFPPDRIAFIAEDAQLRLLVTTASFRETSDTLVCQVLEVDAAADETAQQSLRPLVQADAHDALCYIIYTSGSTGRPKGVAVNHSSICNFISVCTPIYGVRAGDRVYQGMTIAFDFSIEEIWPTFATGATLVAGPTDHRRLGPGLAEFLIEHDVTLLYCVPTLLATLDRDIPNLRTLNVGGEACPRDLVKRWSRAGRRMLNTYGPTETTVTATWAELSPDRPVTIGRPLPTYTAYLLDDRLQPVPDGEAGELCIGGPGVACGYIHRPELTADRFVALPWDADERIYRTGDQGRMTPDGEIEYLGRIDSQVKLRGYRIELSEIEAVLTEEPQVENAVVTVVGAAGAVQDLAAHITLRTSAAAGSELIGRLHERLRRRLPAYMVPAFIEVLDRIPTLASGKADRKQLPAPNSTRLSVDANDSVPPATPLERDVAAVWAGVFERDTISVESDFFLDLGGHSLFAALVVSRLRENPAWRHVSIADVYADPTIRRLAGRIEATVAAKRPTEQAQSEASSVNDTRRHSNARVWTCGAVQMALVYLLLAASTAPLVWLFSHLADLGLLGTLAMIPPTVMLVRLALPVVLKWLLVGRLRPGRYPLWGAVFCRWWLCRKLLALAPLDHLAGSPWLPVYARLLGARIGRGCHLASPRLDLPDLIDIGDGASVGYGAALQPFVVAGGWLHLAPIRIGAGACLGTNAVVLAGGSVGRDARLGVQSLVARGQSIPDGEAWSGSPSARSDADPMMAAMTAREAPRRDWPLVLWLAFAAGFLGMELLPWLLALPGLALILGLASQSLAAGLAAIPVAGLVYVLTVCGVVAVGKMLVFPTARAGIYPLFSLFGLRKWITDKLIGTSLESTNSLYATLYTIPWFRLLGAKVGPLSEISTVSSFDPDLLTLGAECFVADMAVLGAAQYGNGFVAFGPTEVCSRSFVGNAAVVSGGARLGEGCLIGVQSVPPPGAVAPGTSWLGSPGIFLPRRQASEKFDEQLTYRPPFRLVALRLFTEFFRIVLPPAISYLLFLAGCRAVFDLAERVSRPVLVGLIPAIDLATAALAMGIVVGIKWLLMGTYRPRVEPLWSFFVRRTELVTGLYETVAAPWLCEWLTGTPWLPPVLRLFGVKVGRRVYMDTTYITEFDLVHIGDDAAVGTWSSLQTHLFEDQVMKMSVVTVGSRCSVGSSAVVLYDSRLAEESELDGLSLVMKGESLPARTRWQGIPARPAH